MARSAYWHFEPIELQLTLRRIGRGPAVVVPDKLDPGYEDFAIWIRDPGGAVRRYRAPQRYCSNVASRRIAFGRPFYRDVMLFGQAGGYTFRETGAYAVWCEYRCNGVLLASNRLRFVVRRPEPASSSYRELARICGDPAFAEELFHRRDSRNSCDPSLLALLDEREDGDPVVAGLRYAIGRAGVSAWHRQQLIRAQRSGALDGFQRRVVRRALARIEPPGD